MLARTMLKAAPIAAALVALAVSAHAGTLDRMKETGEFRIAVRKDAKPLSYMQDGAPLGYSVSICQQVGQRVAKQTGVESLKYVYVEVGVADRFDAIAEGRADILCGAATITIERREKVDFSIATFVDGASVLLPKGAPTEFEALAGAKIGVLGGTTTEKSLRLTLEQINMPADVVLVADHKEGVAKLEAGEVAAYFGDQSILYHLLAESAGRANLQIGANVLTIEPHGLAVPLGDDAFRREVDRALSHMYRSGVVAETFAASFPGASMGAGMKALTLVAPQPD